MEWHALLISGPTSTWTESAPEHAMSTYSRSQALDLQCHGCEGLGSNQSYGDKTRFSRRTNVNRHQLHDLLGCRKSHLNDLNVSRFSPSVCFPWMSFWRFSPPMQRQSMSTQYIAGSRALLFVQIVLLLYVSGLAETSTLKYCSGTEIILYTYNT